MKQVVYVVDDDEDIGDSLQELLHSVGIAVEVYSSAKTYLKQFSLEQRGCLILDLRMAGMSGLELQRRLNELGSCLPVIFLTAYGDVSSAVSAMKAGAVDFIEKPYHAQNLLDGINVALRLDEKRQSVVAKEAATTGQLDSLTAREKEVMELLLVERTTKCVAQRLNISPRTVEVHRQRVLKKLGVRSVSELSKKL